MTYLYIQNDYAVFGFGSTRRQAIEMAAQWLKNASGIQGCSYEYAASLLVNNPEPGQMVLCEIDETIPVNAENWGGEELLEWYYDVV